MNKKFNVFNNKIIKGNGSPLLVMNNTEMKDNNMNGGSAVLLNEKKDLLIGGNVVFNNPSVNVRKRPIKLNI
jgi:hypothetical protein